MSFHHVAIAAKDLPETHRFYEEAMGFQLVRVEAQPFLEDGWARHLFYDTGNGEMFAIWDLHSPSLPDTNYAISAGLGLPTFVNHIAFASPDLDDLDAKKDRWLAHGHDVVRINHGWCTSIYANDPSGTMVEFCCTTRAFTDDDHREARELLMAEMPTLNKEEPAVEFFEAKSGADAGVS
jgi:catechol 2,3-dioxygenase-like lactoylglutathione lyase family enzyme